MDSELKELLEMQGQLKAMQASVQETTKAMDKRVQEFLTTHLGLKQGENFTLLDLISKLKGHD